MERSATDPGEKRLDTFQKGSNNSTLPPLGPEERSLFTHHKQPEVKKREATVQNLKLQSKTFYEQKDWLEESLLSKDVAPECYEFIKATRDTIGRIRALCATSTDNLDSELPLIVEETSLQYNLTSNPIIPKCDDTINEREQKLTPSSL